MTNTQLGHCEITLREHSDHITLEAALHPTRLTIEQAYSLAEQLYELADRIKKAQPKPVDLPPLPKAKKITTKGRITKAKASPDESA